MRIKKGDSYRCIKDYKMNNGKLEYTQGSIYKAVKDDVFIYDSGDNHVMIVDTHFSKHFENIEKHHAIDITENDKEREFNLVVESTLDEIRELLVCKGKEYRRNNNPYHNFEEGATKTGLIREKVLDGFLLKHEISISDMTNDIAAGILPKESVVNEKFNDNLIYLLIKKAMVLDRIKNK